MKYEHEGTDQIELMLHGVARLFCAGEQGTRPKRGPRPRTPRAPARAVVSSVRHPRLPVTNTIFTAWVVDPDAGAGVDAGDPQLDPTNTSRVPSGLQNFWELIIELWVGISEQHDGPRRGRRFMPLVATAFLFILFSNWFGTLPIGYLCIDEPRGPRRCRSSARPTAI